jgi:hypothetical protein
VTKTLLRSGSLDDFQAVGGGGQAVFDSALQIRETLRLRKQQALVDCLAIPQVNDEGDRVAWYSPVEGSASSWKAADEAVRERARRYLRSTFDSALTLSRKSLASGKTTQQLFGALLEKALQFPGENHVFLVDGKPVITFWGFINLNDSVRDDILDCLREPEPEPPVIEVIPPAPAEAEPEPVVFVDEEQPLLMPEPAPAAVSKLPDTVMQAYAVAQPEAEEPEAEPEINTVADPAPVKRAKRRLPLWSVPVAAIIVVAVAAPLLWKQSTTVAEPVETVAAAPVPAPVVQPVPVRPTLPQVAASLPLHRADVIKTKEEEKPAAPAEPVVIAAIPKDALVMEAAQMRAGTTKFLNGNWRVLIDIKDPVTGKPPSLRYQMQNNKGTARLVHGDNIVCRAEIFSGLHQNGELMIKSRGAARCSDGSRYPMPEITCKAGTSDIAECTGRYDANTVVPLTFKKTGA